MKGGFAQALLALACALAVAGCDGGITGDRGDARQGGSVLVGLAQPPDSLDPALATSPEALQALWLAYTPPMTYRRAEGAQGTQLMPGLAESEPEALDGATAFRFTLRRGLTYSDGRPVLAADVPRAIRRSRALNPRARTALSGIEDVVADERERTRADRPEAAPIPSSPTSWPPCGPRPCRRARPRETCRARRWPGWGPTGSRPARADAPTCSRAAAASACPASRPATSTRSPGPSCAAATGAPRRPCPGDWT